ncbi:MAG: patatin-like phospholipase family protein [Trueperaceae bacterium]|nr:patatin-like phospholipase family protein [Trueperaceae bacterium]
MKIGVVLSGGGARCFAHIGSLKALEEAKYEVCALAGSSSGAVIGALYAAGNSADAIYEIAKSIDYTSFLTFVATGGLINQKGLEEMLAEHVPETFEELKIPLATTAVDIQSAELLVMKSGTLIPAATASNSFPGLFGPLEYEGRYLMDGGILNNFPVDIIRSMTTQPVFAFDVTLSAKEPLDLGVSTDNPGFFQRISAAIKGESLYPPLMIDILMKAYTITQKRLIQIVTSLYPPDHHIRPPLPEDLGIESFGRLEEAYETGYFATQNYLRQL